MEAERARRAATELGRSAARGRALALCALAAACSSPPAALVRRIASGAPAPLAEHCETLLRDPRAPEGAHALGELLRRSPAEPGRAAAAPCADRLVFEAEGPGAFAPDYFDALAPAEDFSVTQLPQHRAAGVGVALLGVRENRQRDGFERHFPPEAIARAVTAVAERDRDRAPSGEPRVRVRLLSPLQHAEVLVDGEPHPLAADFSVPFAALLERTGALSASWLSGLLAERPEREAQLYLMEPYDPDKTPLLMIHGLLSTPLAWAALTNEVWGDSGLRRRYQVWHYHYPTAAPFLYSALILRQQIDEVRALIAGAGVGEIQPMVVVAHSMGGLLAKTLITDSGGGVWRAIFARPAAQLRGRPEDLATVRDILHWRARRHVRHVIFLAVPHRGSDVSLQPLGRLGDALAGVPAEFASLYARIDAENPGALTPAFRRALARGELTSIDTLSPRHPLLPVLASRPFAPWARVDSIVADRGAGIPLLESTDGVVPYTSSHLDRADSEVVVPAGHDALAHPAAIAAILRILALP